MRISSSFIALRMLEVVLGGLFVYAGLQKSLHPYEFAEAVLAYRLVPEGLVGVVVAVLPWVEIVAGLTLVVGLKRRSGLLLLAGLVGGFLAIILISMARGLKIDCGCGLFFQRQVGLVAVMEDAVFLIWAAGLYVWERQTAGRAHPIFFSRKTKTEN
ncbi:MAG: MauE/DoxX family redox-associated membrane protein [Desulfobaccales bacterium]